MSKYLNPYQKQAMWEEHNKKCFYCNEPLAYKNIHVDHVIPQMIFKKNDNDLRQKYSLDESFDFNSLDNFVPACQSCNSNRKGSKELTNGIPLWLDDIKQKKNIIVKRAKKLKNDLALDLPDQYKEFFLSSPDFMLSNLHLEKIRKVDIELYKNLAFSSDRYPLNLTSPYDETVKVHITNLSQYEEYKRKGYYGYTTPEIGLDTFCNACLFFFEKFESAFDAKEKFNFKDYYSSLPATVLDAISTEENSEFKVFATIGEYIEAKNNVFEEFTDYNVKITINNEEFNEQEFYVINEVLQADFTGNGNSESIIFIYYKSGGTLHFSYVIQAVYLNGKLMLQADVK